MLQEKPPFLKREHPALQNMKFLNFFIFLWVIFLLLDPDFLSAPWFYNSKSVFLMVNASFRWLNNVKGVCLVQLSLLLIGQSAVFGPSLQASALASHWLDDCANFMPKPEENSQYSANHS
jgi:hypothetical protein